MQSSKSQPQFREEPIPFVVFNPETRSFEMNEEAGDFLKQLSSPIGIISVAGMYRTGKSYLLNRMLLNRSGGFGVGPTINPCTKGIWIWGKPIQGFTPEGDPIQVLVIDTEGIGALDEDSNHDVRIFSLAILLSSFFIYNSVGSIDESALSNLSLVINLTKHIHLKSTGIQEDVDPEEYAQYFPSFMWVVRDFSLQLVDQEGEPLTSKEYLEKALQQQKGFSDGIEQKNRIRRMLKSFFKETDCCTMIRPLTKEEDLQSLEKMQLDELRPEFVEQVMQLRRKVINRIKPKMMHDKKLNGEMLFNLALTYVEAINKGAVPNIESAWSYICKNECLKAQYDSYSKFEKSLQENFEFKCPMFEDELKEIFKEAKKIGLDEFSKVAVGDVQRQFLAELKSKMKHKFKQVRDENAKLSEEQNLIFLQQNYVTIEKRLKNQEYESLFELLEELKNFQQHFIEFGPPGPNRLIVLNEFLYKSLAEASEFFFRTFSNELFLQKKISEDTLKKLQAEIKEMKEEQKKKVDFFETKLRSVEMEKAESSAKEQSIKENYSQILKEKAALEKEMYEKTDQMKKEMNRQIDEFKNKFSQSEESTKEIQRQQMAAQSEHDKQKALLEQKLEFFEKQLEEAQRKEKELASEVKNQKNSHLSSNKEIQKQYEQQIKDLNRKVDETSERQFEWESKYQELESKYEQESQRWEDSELHIKREFSKLKENYQELSKQNDALKRKYFEEVESMKQNSQDDVMMRNERIQDLEAKLKGVEDSYEMSKQRWDKDLAIFKQKMEFQDLQLKEERIKNEEQKQSHDQMMRSIHSRERDSVIGKEESAKKIAEIKDQYDREFQEIDAQNEQSRLRLVHQIEQLQERNSELELSLKIQVGDFEKEVAMLREQLSSVEEQKCKSQDIIKTLDQQRVKIQEELESRYKLRQQELEREIEEKTRDFEENVKEMQYNSEEQLMQLKNFYEQEKERLEKRIQEEKDRAQKRFNNMVEDYEIKLREESSLREEDVNNLQDEFHQKEAQMNDIIQQLEHDNSLKQQQLESLEKYLFETKDSLNKIQSMQNVAMEQQLDKFNEERKEMICRIDKITLDLAQRERKLTTLENQNESLAGQMAQKDSVIKELRQDQQSEKGDLQDKIEQIRFKNQEILDELTQKKIDYERDKALKTQQLQFQEQRIQELTKQLEDTIRRYDERLKQERDDLQQDMQEKVHRFTQEKETSDKKYEQKRKALKDLESSFNKQISTIEREKAVLQEKFENLENSQKDLIKNYENENMRLKEINEQFSMSINSDKSAIHMEVERWRNQFIDLDRQYQDVVNNYDKDKALWDGKFKFLEQQKETAKRDLEENSRKFQTTIESLQKAQSDNKMKSEMTQSSVIQQIEAKYNQRLKELQDSHQQMLHDFQDKNKQLQKENKQLIEKYEISSKTKITEQGGLEKKVEKLLDEKQRIQEELDLVKQERDSKQIEYQRMVDQERENYKQKMRDIEGKGTRVEAKQTELMLNFEKERAIWLSEKSTLFQQKDDIQENAKRLEMKLELAVRENEKLKNDIKNIRKSFYNASATTNSYTSAVVGSKLLSNIGNYSQFKPGQGVSGMESNRLGLKENSSSANTGISYMRQSVNLTGLSSNAVNNFNLGSGLLESSLIKNHMMSGSSSNQSDERSYKTSSPDRDGN